ncbi:MAG: vacuolar protein sorting/targeting protein PEP1, partial [Watsoniomyces obsoletus]
MSFHGRDPSKVIWNGEICQGLSCDQAAYYTDDDFRTVNTMGRGTRGCQWAVGTPQFGEEIAAEIKDRIFCVVAGLYSPWTKDQRLIVSDDYFDAQQIEPELDDGRT